MRTGGESRIWWSGFAASAIIFMIQIRRYQMTWTLKDWADLAQITLFPTILLSLVGFWFTLNEARKRAIESHKTELERRRMEVETRNERWQKVVIYSTLDAKPLGLTEIRDRFVTMA